MPSTGRRSGTRVGKNGKHPRRHLVTAAQFREARLGAGFDREQAADFVGVSLRTIGHWETGKARPAFAAFKLLRVYRHGDLIDPRWSGYRLLRGKLVTPENHELLPSDMAWLSLTVRRGHAMSELLRQRDCGKFPAAVASEQSSAGATPARVVNLSTFRLQNSTFSPVVPVATGWGVSFGPWTNRGQKAAQLGGVR